MKNQKGITLIALVITIIVLLILAGVAIAMLSGDNGVLNKASDASATNALGAAKDEVTLIATDALTDYYQKVYVKNSGSYSADALDEDILDKIEAATLETKNVTLSVASKKITLTYSDGASTYGELSEGVITWYEITNPGK